MDSKEVGKDLSDEDALEELDEDELFEGLTSTEKS